MKKIKKITTVLLIISLLAMCTACGSNDEPSTPPQPVVTPTPSQDSSDAEYVGSTEFFYSKDGGSSYGNGQKFYNTNEDVFIKIIIKAITNVDNADNIKGFITVPYREYINVVFSDGLLLGDPIVDEQKGAAKYNFEMPVGTVESEWEYIFKIESEYSDTVQFKVEYTQGLSSFDNRQSAIEFKGEEPPKVQDIVDSDSNIDEVIDEDIVEGSSDDVSDEEKSTIVD